MKTLFPLLICATLLIFLTGCFENSSSSDGDSGTTGKSNSTGVTKVSDSNSVSKDDTTWYEVATKTGYSYTIDLRYKDNGYYLSHVTVSPGNNKTNDYSFRSLSDGIYRVGVYVNYAHDTATEPFEFSFSVKEYPPMPAEFSGKWLLVKEKGSAFGGSSEFLYSTANAMEVLEFRNDSVIDYGFDAYNNELSVDAVLFASSWESEMKYTFSGNSLLLSSSNKYGSSSFHYEKFEGDINSLKWARQDFKAPSELIGTWYLSLEKWRGVEFEDGELYEEQDEEIYNSGEESQYIIVITRDSVTSYSKSGFTVDTSKYKASEYYWRLSNYSIEGNTFTKAYYESESWDEDGVEEYESWSEIETYTKHLGFTPPLEWYEVNMPSIQTALPLNMQHSAAITLGDTLWYKIAVEEDSSYDVTFTQDDNCDIDLYVLDADTTQIETIHESNESQSFTATVTGEYYLAVILDYINDKNSAMTYSIKYENRSSRRGASSSSTVKGVEKERRLRRRER